LYTYSNGVWDGSNFTCGGFYCQFSSRDTIWEITQDPPTNYQNIIPIRNYYGNTCLWTFDAFQEVTECIPSIKQPVFLIRTYSKKFVLIKVISQKKYVNSGTKYSTADISWWLQDDGSCNLSTLTTSVSQKKKTVMKNFILMKNRFLVLSKDLILPEGNYYDYQGRQVSLRKITGKNFILIRGAEKKLKIRNVTQGEYSCKYIRQQ
jgi:hypothetical protein